MTFSSYNLDIYRDFIKVFVNNPKARFAIMGVKKSLSWNRWAKNKDERIFKPYYYFLIFSSILFTVMTFILIDGL